jgi:uncharacterized membrane protein YgaE (UPF0421/DUF939 family)
VVAAAVADGWRRLRRLGVRRWVVLERRTLLQIAKTALAATLSWELAIRLLHSPLPALAALGALLTVQVTVKQTVSFGIQQVVGVTVGVGAAGLVVGVLGVHAWSVGLVILGALVVGNLLRLGRQINQVAISALLVLALGTAYGSARVVDTLLGAVVGVLVNALVAPPTHVQDAAEHVARVAGDLGLLLTDVAGGLRAGWDHGTATDWLRRARDADAARAEAGEGVRRADESLRYNPLARAEAETVARLAEAHTATEHSATQLRGIARALADLAPEHTEAERGVLDRIADLLEQAGTAVAAYGRTQVDPAARADLERAHDAARESLARVSDALAALPSGQDPRTLVSIFIDAGRMLHEVAPDGAHAGAIPG